MTGRPTKLTPEVQKVIVEAVERGNYHARAAALAGISERTFYSWQERGETGEEPYASFLQAVKKAEAIAEDETLFCIQNAQPAADGRGADLWQAKAWVMERRWPARWSGRVRVTVDQELAAVLKRIESKLDPETFAKVIDATREDAAEAKSDGAEARH